MPSGSGTLGIGSGLARGLAAVFLNKRQQDTDLAAKREARSSQNALEAADYLIRSGRVADYSEIQPLFDLAMGTGGKKSKAGDVDPHEILSQVLGPAMAHASANGPLPSMGAPQPPQPPAAAAEQGPQEPGAAVLPSRPIVTPPPAAPRQRLMGVGLLSDEEMAQRAGNAAATTESTTANRRVDIARDLYQKFRSVDPDFTLRDALRAAGFQIDTTRAFQPKTIGKPIKADDVPADATDEQGGKIDPTKAGYWQPIQGAKGTIYYTPGAEPTNTFKPLTGALGERYREILARNGLTEPDAAKTPDAVTKYTKLAADELAQEHAADRAQKGAAADSVAANRELRNALLRLQTSQGGLTPSQLVSETRAFTTQWTKAITPFRDRQTYVAKLDEGIKMIPKDRNAATQTIVNSFNRLLEEGNAVREGEYNRSEEMAPLLTRASAAITKLTQGGGSLTDDQLKSLATEGKQIAKVTGEIHQQGLQDLRQAITEQLTAYKIPESRVFGSSPIGARAKTAPGDAERRTRARQTLVQAGKQADDATIDTFLKNNPSFK